MGCTNKDHNINCRCHTGAPPEPIYVDDENLVSYYNLLAGLPETEKLQQELNQTIIDCGGLEEACNKYPYVEMDLCRDGIFRPVDGRMFPRYSNIFHIMRAKRKFDLPDEGKKPLTKKMIEEHNARCASIAQAEQAPRMVAPQPTFQQPSVKSNEDDFSFDLSSIVEGYDSIDVNERPVFQKTAMRETARLFKLSNLVEGYEDEEPQVQEQMYANPNVGFAPAATPMQELFAQPNMYVAPMADNYAPRMGNVEDFGVSVDFGRLSTDAQTTVSSEDVSLNGSSLLGQEEETFKIEFKQEHMDEFKSIEEDYEHASRVIHPNDPRCYATFQPAVDPRTMGAMMSGGVGIPYIGGMTPNYSVPSSLPFRPSASYAANMTNTVTPTTVSAEAPKQKSPMRLAMEKAGLHPKTVGELNASAATKGLPPVTKPGITTVGGQECFSLDALRAQHKQQARTPEQIQREIECEQSRQEAREYWDRMRRPNWEPQNPILKTPEFPEGITKDHPEFNRVLTQIRAENQAFSAMETGMAHDMTTNAGEFDPGNPASYTKLQDDPTDEEVAKLFHDSQFAERQKAYNAAKTDEERQAAMEGKLTSPLKMNIPPGVYAPGLNGTKSVYLNSSTAMSPSMYGGYYDDDAYLRATPEEIKNGVYPKVTVVKMSEEELRAEREEALRYDPPATPGKITMEEFKVAVVKVHYSEDGTEEWDEFIAGDREAALEERHPAMDYKEATDYKSRLKAEDEIYTLARELGRYNKVAADTLLWYRNNVPLCDFIEVKREAQQQLMDYRNADNLSSAKSTVIIAGDKTIVSDPKPMTIEELEDLANKEAKKLEKPSQIEQTLSKYRNPVNKQLSAVFNDDSLAMKIQRLQALSNIRVVSCADDKLMKLMDARDEQMPSLAKAQKDNYILWKNLKWRAASEEERKTFDEDFDRWWNIPNGGVTNTKESAWREYVKQRNLQNQVRYMNMQKNHKSDEQRRAEYNAVMEYRQRQFDHGTIRDDMTANELFEAFGYLKTRMLEMEIEKQKQDVRRLYDPSAYLAEVRKHSAIRNMQEGKGFVPTMDLMDKGVYNKKRQAFLNSIWERAERGTIT